MTASVVKRRLKSKSTFMKTHQARNLHSQSFTRSSFALCLSYGLALISMLSLRAADSAPSASRMPEFSWDRVPQYMHIRKWKNYTPDEIRYLATFPLVTLEKANGYQVFKTSEDGTLAAARAVLAALPGRKARERAVPPPAPAGTMDCGSTSRATCCWLAAAGHTAGRTLCHGG